MIVPVNNCNICLENSNKSISCIKCKNSYVCYKCLERLEKIGLNKKCPICRQEDWYNNIQDNKVIIDINFEQKNENQIGVRTLPCNRVNNYRRLSCVLMLLGISYGCGFITMVVIKQKPINKINVIDITIIAFLLGIMEVNLVLFTCYKFVCKENIRSCDQYINALMR